MINEVIEEEDEDKNNKKDIHHIINNNFHNNNRIGLKKANSNSVMNNYMKNVERKINYIPYNKNNIKKYYSESLIQIKKNDYKKLLSFDDKNQSVTFKIDDKSKKNIINSNSTNSSTKNLFINRRNLSNYKNIFKDEKIFSKWSNLSNKQANSNEIIFSKRIYNKNLSFRKKVIKDSNIKESSTLPELKPNYKSNRDENFNANHFKKIPIIKSKTIFKSNNFRAKSVSSDKINVYNDKFKSNLINYSPSTSAYTNSNKQISSNKSNSNDIKEELSKYRIGLLSAGSSSYNNVIIPMLSLRRPISNFNLGREKLIQNVENNININIKNEKKEENNSPVDKENNVFKSIYLAKKEEYKERLCDSENNDDLMYKNMKKLIPKFHKIKIEKGMMNTKIANSLGKKLFINYYNQHNKNTKTPIRFNNERKIL